MVYTQENRLIAIDTPLGENVLLLQRFAGTEGLSSPFSFELDLASENNNIAFEDIIGQNVTVSIVLANGERRFFNGIISRFSQYGGAEETDSGLQLAYYSATMVPWFWLLSRTSDSRIFQRLSVPDIVEQIFTEKGFNDFRINLHDSYNPKEYCVQYRETDFNFVSRLLEQEGIFYFFEHEQNEEGKHTMVLADSPEEHRPCPGQDPVRYHPLSGSERSDEDVITSLDKTQEIRIAKYTVNDFNFTMPTTDLKVEVSSQQALGPGESDRYEVYDYPAEYNVRSEGDRLANIRMQAEEARITTITGTSTCRAFTSGYRFDLTVYYRDEMNDNPYVLTSVQHSASEAVGTSGEGQRASYSNSFTCLPFDVPYRPSLVTPKPMIGGTQTAIVVGPSGEEIYTDEHGRVKAQFHWDRQGNRDENSSCWMRVSQVSAGAGWGSVYIPRIGHEVIVEFLEGDPDRPVITGCLYNGTNTPPFGLPGGGMISGSKSNSTPGGGGYNEMSLNDTKGEEKLIIHGQYDMESTIEHDQTLTVHNNRTSTIDVDDSETVGSNQTVNVGANQDVTVGANQSIKVGANKTESIAIAKALSIGAAYQVSVGAAMNETVGAAKAEEIGAAKIVAVGANSSENVGANKSVNAGGNISESAGKDVSIKSGKKMALSAGDDFGISGGKKGVIEIKDQLTIKCGSASITLKKNGDIKISGKKIEVSGTQDVKLKAMKITSEAKTKSLTKGAMVNVEASGINTIKGSLVKIN